MSRQARTRKTILVFLGISGLLIKRWMSSYIGEIAYSYLGNLSVSFAVYFLVSLASESRFSRFVYVIVALVAVESFELANGFGIMANVYDEFDHIANAIGVALAFVVDLTLDRILAGSPGAE